MSKLITVCLDSNIYVSAVGFGGKPLKVVELALERAFLLVTSDHILKETKKNLVNKVGVKRADVEAFLADIMEIANLFTPTGSLKITDDPADNKVLETALMGFANILVTGDRALVDLRAVGDLKIETTSSFLKRVKAG